MKSPKSHFKSHLSLLRLVPFTSSVDRLSKEPALQPGAKDHRFIADFRLPIAELVFDLWPLVFG
jgi:hypothetical protein